MSGTQTITHVGFSDESNWNVGRFRSLGLVTLRLQDLAALQARIRALLKESEVREFHWRKLRGARERFAAVKLCELAVAEACARRLRLDILVWDMDDNRHQVRGRDDVKDLARMYYHLFRNVMRARWPHEAVWRLCPDEHTAIGWQTMSDCLDHVSTRLVGERSVFTGGELRLCLAVEFGIEEIIPIRSEDAPGVQLADLFAGLAVFSRARYDSFEAWRAAHDPQMSLWKEDHTGSTKLSTAERERFQVLAGFDRLCKGRKLGVSLASKRGLWTPRPQDPLNFWLYEPQSELDKAPT